RPSNRDCSRRKASTMGAQAQQLLACWVAKEHRMAAQMQGQTIPQCVAMDGFTAQRGDPTGTGRGGPGYQFANELRALALRTDGAGMLSMANAHANTNGSQVFVAFRPTPYLNGRYSIFGSIFGPVIRGLDVVSSIREHDPQRVRQPGDTIYSLDFSEQ